MKVTMQMTLDGLIRALRLKAHALADDVEAGYIDGLFRADELPASLAAEMRARTKEQDDARAGR
jgi:hypothetical protein